MSNQGHRYREDKQYGSWKTPRNRRTDSSQARAAIGTRHVNHIRHVLCTRQYRLGLQQSVRMLHGHRRHTTTSLLILCVLYLCTHRCVEETTDAATEIPVLNREMRVPTASVAAEVVATDVLYAYSVLS